MHTQSEAEKRKYPRMRVTFDVEVFHPSVGFSRFQTRDMSHEGMFILDGDGIIESLPEKGQIVTVLIKGLIGDEPMTVDMRVVRNSIGGKGLAYI